MTAHSPTGEKTPRGYRVESVDALRGIVMVLMVLDHARDYLGDLGASPTNLASASAALFLTRWITYLCAPVFFLLTGVGAYLSLQRLSRSELARFLVTRGIWLIVLECVVVRFAWQFNLDYRLTVLTVLWALGFAMIFLGCLVRLNTAVVATIGVAMILLHNLLDGISPAAFGVFAPVWNVLHVPGFLLHSDRFSVFLAYPLIPWIGVTAAGFGLAQVYGWDSARRRAFLLRMGATLCVAFVVLRFINLHGDPAPWSVQENAVFTVLSFLNATKYPPSLIYLLMTLGPALLLLRWLDDGVPAGLRPAIVIGTVPLFYYVLHIVLIHVLAVGASFVRYGDIAPMLQSPDMSRFPITQPSGWPLSLAGVYVAWAGIVFLLYPLSRWYARIRQQRRTRWLSYL